MSKNYKWWVRPVKMALNALVDSFLPQSEKCGAERVKSINQSINQIQRRLLHASEYQAHRGSSGTETECVRSFSFTRTTHSKNFVKIQLPAASIAMHVQGGRSLQSVKNRLDEYGLEHFEV